MSNTSTLIIELTNNRPRAPVYLVPEYELSLFVELGWADIHAAVSSLFAKCVRLEFPKGSADS